MKKIFTFLLVVLPFLAQAQLEVYVRYAAHASPAPDLNFFKTRKIMDKVSLTFFGLVEQKWAEALIGISYSPSDFLTLGISAGMEHGTSDPRFSASIRAAREKVSFLFLGESGSGAGNYLYKTSLFYNYSKWFTFGLTAWRYHGVGANLRLYIPAYKITVWAMPAYDIESDAERLIIGSCINL
jgi:hypothetical protein